MYLFSIIPIVSSMVMITSAIVAAAVAENLNNTKKDDSLSKTRAHLMLETAIPFYSEKRRSLLNNEKVNGAIQEFNRNSTGNYTDPVRNDGLKYGLVEHGKLANDIVTYSSSSASPSSMLKKFSGPIVVIDDKKRTVTTEKSSLSFNWVDRNETTVEPQTSMALEENIEIQKSVEVHHNAPVQEIHYPAEFVPTRHPSMFRMDGWNFEINGIASNQEGNVRKAYSKENNNSRRSKIILRELNRGLSTVSPFVSLHHPHPLTFDDTGRKFKASLMKESAVHFRGKNVKDSVYMSPVRISSGQSRILDEDRVVSSQLQTIPSNILRTEKDFHPTLRFGVGSLFQSEELRKPEIVDFRKRIPYAVSRMAKISVNLGHSYPTKRTVTPITLSLPTENVMETLQSIMYPLQIEKMAKQLNGRLHPAELVKIVLPVSSCNNVRDRRDPARRRSPRFNSFHDNRGINFTKFSEYSPIPSIDNSNITLTPVDVSVGISISNDNDNAVNHNNLAQMESFNAKNFVPSRNVTPNEHVYTGNTFLLRTPLYLRNPFPLFHLPSSSTATTTATFNSEIFSDASINISGVPKKQIRTQLAARKEIVPKSSKGYLVTESSIMTTTLISPRSEGSLLRRARQPVLAEENSNINFKQSRIEYGFKPPMIPSVQYDEKTATKMGH